MSEAWIPRCFKCNDRVDPDNLSVWHKVEGWEKKRDGGGTNHVALRKPLGQFMCNGCMSKLQAGVDAGQLTL